jgi:hypothetical protein
MASKNETPARLPLKIETIPQEIKDSPQWCLWRWEQREGKWTKPPYQVNGEPAKSNDYKTWTTFKNVLEAYQRGMWDGIGFMLTSPFVGIDLDNCRNPDTGELRDWARPIIEAFLTYTEVSPSKTGLKLLLKGRLAKGHHNNHIGVFQSGRYFCVTGHVLNGRAEIEDRQHELDQFIKDEWPADFKSAPHVNQKAISSQRTDDNAIVDKMLAAKNGAKILELMNGKWEGDYHSQSEADAALCAHIAFWTKDPAQVDRIFRQSGLYREKWERQDYRNRTIQKAIVKTPETYSPPKDVAARVREYLLDEFDGGVFKLSDLRKELGLNDKQYALARQCLKRMVEAGQAEKHGHALGLYRVIDRRKEPINWNATQAQASPLILPGNLHEIVKIRNGDLIAFAAYKNHAKTAVAIEIIRLNLENFTVHFFITEYQDRMKKRLLDFGIELSHPNFRAYPIEKTDYIPDKIETGPGVLNVIDHLPMLDNLWLVGKYQDEIHRSLDGAICVVTHQKLKPEDEDAVGKSWWLGTPTLAVTLFWDKDREYAGKMKIRKGKEPAPNLFYVEGLELQYNLRKGSEFEYDPKGWR